MKLSEKAGPYLLNYKTGIQGRSLLSCERAEFVHSNSGPIELHEAQGSHLIVSPPLHLAGT